MISRFLLALGLAVLMIASSVGSYMYLGSRQSHVVTPPQKPTVSPRPHPFVLPGTLYLAQSGAIYSLNAGRFHQLTGEDGWMQPALYPDGSNLLVVKRGGFSSDVFELSRFGQVEAQLTNNVAPARSYDTGDNHWSFYPRLSPDQRTLYMSYDDPKYGYDVNMSVWAIPYGGSIRQGVLWTNSNDYTGGDMQPIPLASGGLLYTKYDYGPDSKLIGQIFFTNRPYSYGRALTSTSDDCSEPSLSPDAHELAMICTHEKQISHLVISAFDPDNGNIGPLQEIITDQLVAQPAWAPDGSGIAYLAPAVSAGPFQLWWLPKNAYAPPPPSPVPSPTPTPGGPHSGEIPSPTPSPIPTAIPVRPIQVTTNLGFDATSPMSWGV